MKTMEVTTSKEIRYENGQWLDPGTYTGTYIEDGVTLHEPAVKPGNVYRIYTIPSVKIKKGVYEFNLTFFDSEDILLTPKKLVSEKILWGYVGGQPVYEDIS